MTVIAPFILQSGRVDPYVTLEEVKFSPTAAQVDFTNLVASGGAAAQDRGLYELIVRASSQADVYCLGKYGTLNATSNTESLRKRTNRNGEFMIRPSFSPILAVTNFNWGYDPSCAFNVALNSTNCFIERESFTVVGYGNAATTPVVGLGSIVTRNDDSNLWCNFTYVNGWANTFLSAQTASGSTTLPLKDATGIYPGMQLTIWDGVNDEWVTVSSTYTAGNLSVPITTATQYSHGLNTNVSALPATVKQAVIHLVVAMVKERGDDGLVLSRIGEAEMAPSKGGLSEEDTLAAYDLLDEFKTISGLL